MVIYVHHGQLQPAIRFIHRRLMWRAGRRWEFVSYKRPFPYVGQIKVYVRDDHLPYVISTDLTVAQLRVFHVHAERASRRHPWRTRRTVGCLTQDLKRVLRLEGIVR